MFSLKKIPLAIFALAFSFQLAGAEPPAVYPKARYYKDKGLLTMEYNKRVIMTAQVPPGEELVTRATSDGCIISTPLYEQFYLSADKEMTATLTFDLPGEAICMRPKRALDNQAVLGQVGHPLIYGVNGIYSLTDDLMIDWTDARWKWLGERFEIGTNGNYVAKLEVNLKKGPWLVNIRPLYYKEHLGYRYYEPWNFRPKREPVAGWCSWLAYYQGISEKLMLEVADMLTNKFAPYGLTYLQIDDGFQDQKFGITKDKTLSESWLSPIDGFPNGITSTAKLIAKKGLKPGVWMNTDIRTYDPPEGAKDVIFRNPDGSPMRAAWLSYANDCTDESLNITLGPLWDKLVKAGYVYIKIDALRHTCFDALGNAVSKGLITMEEARKRLRRLFEVAREKAGKDTFLLSCWGTFTENIGLVDASRISTDTNTNWERLLLQQYELARFWPLQRIIYQLDPDHICSRAQSNWARATLSTVSLCGGLFMISDPIQSYDEKLTRAIQKVLPNLPTYPAETAPIDFSAPSYAGHIWTPQDSKENPIDDSISGIFPGQDQPSPFGTLWAYHIDCEAGRWAVLQRNALWKLPEAEIRIKDLGLDPKEEYLVFDSWKGKFLGTVKEKIKLPEMRTGDSLTCVLRKKTGLPQVIGTSRHIAGGYVELEKEEWLDNELFHIVTKEQPELWTAFIYLPDGYEPFSTVNMGPGSVELVKRGANVAELRIKGAADVQISFKSKSKAKRSSK